MSDKDNGVIWEEPPSHRRRDPGVWVQRLMPLTEYPERWAMVHECGSPSSASSYGNSLRRNVLNVPAGRWEFATRGTKIYARYLGPEEQR